MSEQATEAAMNNQDEKINSFYEEAEAAETVARVDELEAALEISGLPPLVTRRIASLLRGKKAHLTVRSLHLTERSLRLGTHFSRIDEVFVQDEKDGLGDFGKVNYMNSCRPKYKTEDLDQKQSAGRNAKRSREEEEPGAKPGGRTIRTRFAAKQQDVYQITYSAAKTAGGPATNDGQSRQSSHAQNRYQIWKKAAVGADPAGDIAHLVPASVNGAHSYWFVTDFLFGFDESRKWKETQCLLHGTNGTGSEGAKSKIHHSGIKHMVTNKVLLANQRDYFDAAPCVMIVPILIPAHARDWTGGGYPAIMLIDRFGEGPPNTLESVCNLTHFTFYDESISNKAERKDLEIAEALLKHYTKAILYAQLHRKPEQADFDFTAPATAFIPKLSGDVGGLHVRKIYFSDNGSAKGHPAPDPLLLVSKAVAVLQKRHGCVVARAEPADNHVLSDASIEAEEDYLRRREAAMPRPDPIGLNVIITK